MTGAMYAAIAGLKTHMQNLNVIGNNVANINTYSYKAGRSVFQTAIYTQLTGAPPLWLAGTPLRSVTAPAWVRWTWTWAAGTTPPPATPLTA